MADEDELLGSSLVVSIDGQKVAGRITAVHDSTLEVTLNVRQAATGYKGVLGTTVLPDGTEVRFDLGRHSHFTALVLEVPRPRAVRQAVLDTTERPAEERRMYFRLPTECEVEVIEDLGHTRNYVRARGQTINISGGGMLVQLNKALLPGEYKFRIHLPTETLMVEGAVIRNKKQAALVMPVEFVNMHEVERSKLIRFIFKRMRNIRDEVATKKANSSENPRYWARREKYMKPPRPRYW